MKHRIIREGLGYSIYFNGKWSGYAASTERAQERLNRLLALDAQAREAVRRRQQLLRSQFVQSKPPNPSPNPFIDAFLRAQEQFIRHPRCLACWEILDADFVARCAQQKKTPLYCPKHRKGFNQAMKRKRAGQDVNVISVGGIYCPKDPPEKAAPGTPSAIEAEIARRRREEERQLNPGAKLFAGKPKDPLAEDAFQRWRREKLSEAERNRLRFQLQKIHFRKWATTPEQPERFATPVQRDNDDHDDADPDD